MDMGWNTWQKWTNARQTPDRKAQTQLNLNSVTVIGCNVEQVCMMRSPVIVNITEALVLGAFVHGGHVCRLQCVLGHAVRKYCPVPFSVLI